MNESRNLNQNALLHSLCGQIAKQRQWAGQKLDTEGWKRLVVDAWARETGRSPGKVVPSLDWQSVVVLNISTRKLGKRDFAELVDWLLAWCDQEDIKISAPAEYEEWAQLYRRE
jgi:hypothetical protein